MGSGFAKRKKAAKAMQEKFSAMKDEMENTEEVGEAGGGLVKVTLSGAHVAKKVQIDPKVVDPDDIEGLEDLVLAAINDASKKLEAKMPGGGGMPDLGGLAGMLGM